jgi:uncharacterized membrane protein YhaH (DUF805 family)
MTLADYFLSPRGRITRQEFWLGMAVLMAATVAGAAIIDPNGLSSATDQIRPPSWAATIWTLALMWPSTAVSLKRFNDRDWPRWVGYAAGAGEVAFVIANAFGFLLDTDRMGAVEKVVMLVAAGGFMWALLENGTQRGTAGNNRYGADPLE